MTDEWDGVDRRTPPPKNFWNGPAAKVMMVLVAVLGFFGAIIFREVSDIPKIYSTKVELIAVGDRVETGFASLRQAIDDINKYLRGQP